MYRYLDRKLSALDEREAFLLSAMRSWVAAARGGRCNCRALQSAFYTRGIAEAISDFGILMATLDREALTRLRFAARNCDKLTDDEARLLALFAVAHSGPIARVKRAAATLVLDDAVARLAQAADFVAMALSTAKPASAT